VGGERTFPIERGLQSDPHPLTCAASTPQPLPLSPIFTVEYITLGYDHPKSEEGVIRHYQPLGPIWCQVWCQNATILTVFADSSDY